jgi:hypothetical protein
MPGAAGLDPFAASAPGIGQTAAHLETIQRKRHGFALFHDGNAGHLWRGEVASLLGESILSVGVIIWLAYLTGSPLQVTIGLLALGLPWLAFLPFAPGFENSRDPGKPLAWAGRIRMVAALGVVGMHFLTIYPILYALLVLIGLMGRVRQALRVAATRVCLEPGEIELVSDDVFVGAALTSVIGPLLAAALFLALDQRVILIGVVAAALFLLSSNSDGFLDALPEERRAFNLVTTTNATPDDAARKDLIDAARAHDLSEDASVDENAPLTPAQRARAMPEWYQIGPRQPFQVIAEIRAGLGLAGGHAASATALLALAALALAGGCMGVLEVFYVTDWLGLPVYYLGALVALEAAGLTLGAFLAGSGRLRPGGQPALIGLVFSGVALVALAVAPFAYVAYGATLLLGIANGVSVSVARNLLRAGHDGPERRALSAGEAALTALASAAGALFFAIFYQGSSRASFGSHPLFPGLPLGLLIGGMGAGLIVAGFILVINPGLRDRVTAPKAERTKSSANSARDISAKLAALPGASGKFSQIDTGKKGQKSKKGAAANPDAVGSLWDNVPEADEGGYRGSAGAQNAYRNGGQEEEYEDEGDYADEEEEDWDRPRGGRGAPPRGGGRPPAGPRGGPRSRW